MPALTHAEALARRELLDPLHYDVDLDLSHAEPAEDFTSKTVVRFACSAPGSASFIDLKAVRLLGAELNGAPLDPGTWLDGRLPLPDLRESNELVVRASFAYSRTGEGLHRFVDPEDDAVYLYSQAFLDDAPRVFACFDQPDLKATFSLSVTAPATWTVLANTDGTQSPSGRWVFEQTRPISTYLVAVVAGPYRGAREHHDGVDIGVWCRQSMWPYLDPDRMLATTRTGLDYFHGLFDLRYPFGKYDQVMVPEFNAGAMENPGLVTFRDDLYLPRGKVTVADREQLANTQLHEMAHMWFGDLVTMRWWDDLWLNESFADYLAHRACAEATEHTQAWTTFLIRRKAWGYRADQLSTTHPVAGDVADTAEALLNFDGISYAKGASALRQLVEWVGDEAFVAALRTHFRDHAYGNATLADLVAALERSSGRDVGTWAQQWLRTTGVSTLAADAEVGPDGRWTRVAVEQRGAALRPHAIAVGVYDAQADGRLTRRDVLRVDVGPQPTTEVPELTGQRAADLLLLNEGDLTFALLDLDERSLDVVRTHLAGLVDPLARAVLWTALWEMVGHGRLAPSDLVRLVVSAVGPHDPPAVVGPLLQRTAVAADLLCDPGRRGDVLALLAEHARSRGEQAEPGSDVQLQLARTYVQVTADAGPLRSWLEGDDVPSGLTVDADLRWRTLQRLAAMGAADESDVAAEVRRDASSSGALHALSARTAMPTAEAKELAWARAVGDQLSNHELIAVGQGFWHVDQDELLAPFATRFAQDFPGLARRVSPHTVQTFGRLLFPSVRVEDATVELAEGLLRDGRLSASARRVLAESRDDVQRALRARAADARVA